MRRPQLGIVSFLRSTPLDIYTQELLNLSGANAHTESVTSEDGALAIVELVRKSTFSVFTGSNDNLLLEEGHIDYNNVRIRNGLAALLYMLQHEPDHQALFVCFSSQLLALALSISEEYKHVLSLEEWENFDYETMNLDHPLGQLSRPEIGISDWNGRPILSVHQQYVDPHRLRGATKVQSRKVQEQEASMVFRRGSWTACQFHPDLSARHVSDRIPDLTLPTDTHWLLTEMVEAAKLSAL